MSGQQVEDAEVKAFEALREVVTLAKNGIDYTETLKYLKTLLPAAPGVQAAIDQWFRRQ